MKRRARLRARRRLRLEAPTTDVRRIAKNTLVLYFRMFVAMAVGLYTSRVLLKALGVEDFGLYNVAGAVVGLCVFLNGTLSAATSRFITVEMGKGTLGSLKRLFSTLLTVHVGLALLAVALLETLGLMVLRSKLNIDPGRIGAVMWAYQCVVVTTALGITQVPYSAVLIAHERMSAFAYMSLFDVFAKLGIAFGVMFIALDKLKVYATLLALVSLTSLAIYRIYCIRNFPEARWRRVFDATLLRPVFAFAGWQVAASVIIMLMTQGVTMLNQRYFGPALVAAGALAFAVQGHVMGFIGNLKTAAVPQIVKVYASGDYAGAKRLLIETTLCSVYLLAVLGTPLVMYAEDILWLWLGQIPQWSPTILRIALCSAFCSIFDSSFYIILYASGNLRSNAFSNLITGGTMFLVIFLAVVLTHWPLAAFLGLFVDLFILATIAKPFLLHHIAHYRWPDFWAVYKPSLQVLALCIAIGCAIKALTPAGAVWALVGSAVSATLVAFSIFLFIMSSRQRELLLSFAARIPVLRRLLSLVRRLPQW